MTEQEIFDKVAKHLTEQGEPSTTRPIAGSADAADEVVTCCYRHTKPDGKQLSCAIGCLIPDDEYQVEIEGYGINALADTYKIPSVIEVAGECGIDFLEQLQSAHDRTADAMHFDGVTWDQGIRAQLYYIARYNGLDFTVLGDVSALREAS